MLTTSFVFNRPVASRWLGLWATKMFKELDVFGENRVLFDHLTLKSLSSKQIDTWKHYSLEQLSAVKVVYFLVSRHIFPTIKATLFSNEIPFSHLHPVWVVEASLLSALPPTACTICILLVCTNLYYLFVLRQTIICTNSYFLFVLIPTIVCIKSYYLFTLSFATPPKFSRARAFSVLLSSQDSYPTNRLSQASTRFSLLESNLSTNPTPGLPVIRTATSLINVITLIFFPDLHWIGSWSHLSEPSSTATVTVCRLFGNSSLENSTSLPFLSPPALSLFQSLLSALPPMHCLPVCTVHTCPSTDPHISLRF